MNKGFKIALIVAGALILVGIVLCIIALALNGFKPFKLGSGTLVEASQTVTEEFSGITVECSDCDVQLLPSSDGSCRIDSKIGQRQKLTVSVKGGVLKVKCEDTRKWYELFGFHFGSTVLKLYLPKEAYEKLTVSTASGDVAVGAPFSFTEASLRTASGELSFTAQAEASLTLETASGDVTVKGLSGEAKIQISTASGDIDISRVTCAGCTVNSASGEVDLEDVILSGRMQIHSVSGDVELERCDAGSISIHTTSGDVEGTLLTGKQFKTRTASGDVRVPSDSGSGACEIKTASGDIEIKVLD